MNPSKKQYSADWRAGMIKTKSVRNLSEKSDGERILVTRYWPRGFTKQSFQLTAWLSNLAPSKELLMAWKSESISWEEYTERYIEEMSDRQEDINVLAKKVAAGTITLLCFEPEDDPHCHRHILKKLIENR